MKYLSVCSGIESASVAWAPLEWEPIAFSEIEKFPSAVLKYHYPHVPNLGDMTKFQEWDDYEFDLLVGGTPCQSFSVAGLRKGLSDPRGNLMLTYLAIARRYRPQWLVWENVPGVLSSDKGRAFGSLVKGMEELGYHAAWRVLDAQYVRVDGYGRAVPQRRRRVFVVGYLGDWRRAAAVLFDAESMSGNSAPSRKTGKGFAAEFGAGVEDGSGEIVGALNSVGGHSVPGNSVQDAMVGQLRVGRAVTTGHGRRYDFETDDFVVSGTLRGEGFDGSDDGTRGQLIAFSAKDSGGDAGDISPTLRAGGHSGSHENGGVMPAIATQSYAFQPRIGRNGRGDMGDVVSALNAQSGETGKGDAAPCVATPWAVRRLMPIECERLQGFPDKYTDVPYRGRNWTPDGPRYKALGNSMAVNAMRWIGRRIELADAWANAQDEAAK